MNDDKNLNQPVDNTNIDDYQKILDKYAASVKPEDDQSPQTDNPKTAKPEPTAELKEVDSDIKAEDPLKLKDINSLQLEAPDNQPLPASLPEEKIIASSTEKPSEDLLPDTPIIAKPDEETLPSSTPEITPSPIAPQSEKPPVVEEKSKTPEEIKAEINKILTDEPTDQATQSEANSKPKSSGLKGIFVFALIIFFLVVGAWAYFLFLYQPSNNSSKSVTTLPTPTETVSQGTCELNGETYQVGESFASADGCNTCTCTEPDMIACTEKACTTTPSVSTATPSASTTIPKDWKIYTDSTYEFSVGYPSDWVVKKESNGLSLASAEMNKKIESEGLKPSNGPEVNISVYDSFLKLPEHMIGQSSSKSTKSLKEYVNFYLSKVKEISINGTNGYSGYTELPKHDIYLQKGNKIILLSEIGEGLTNNGFKADQKTIDMIISTVKFN